MAKPRWRPQGLPQKLLYIRRALNLSQSELHKALGFDDEEIPYNRISDYEKNKCEPPLPVLVEYARVARVHLEDIADDRVNLPENLPGTVTREAWKRPRPKRPPLQQQKTKTET